MSSMTSSPAAGQPRLLRKGANSTAALAFVIAPANVVAELGVAPSRERRARWMGTPRLDMPCGKPVGIWCPALAVTL